MQLHLYARESLYARERERERERQRERERETQNINAFSQGRWCTLLTMSTVIHKKQVLATEGLTEN